MQAKPGITIVGAGNLANALALALRRAGYRIEEIVARSRGPSLKKAQKLAKKIGAQATTVSSANLHSQVVWFCVPDAEIADAAQALAGKISWIKKIAFHSSGALASDQLESLRRRGAAVASAHPMMTFVRGMSSESSSGASFGRSGLMTSTFKRPFNNGMQGDRVRNRSLLGVSFAIEGDRTAVRIARRIVRDLEGQSYPIRKADKAAYHAWGTFASPLLTALLVTAERVAGLAGVSRKSARKRMMPILQQTLANYAHFKAHEAFSGPIIRGDVDTIKQHLQVLRAEPAARDVYLALARVALQYLPAKNKSQLKDLLKSTKPRSGR
jgi:predicted short-subunit dehydrogenase-like oxidoreductase (DUF2520 family)